MDADKLALAPDEEATADLVDEMTQPVGNAPADMMHSAAPAIAESPVSAPPATAAAVVAPAPGVVLRQRYVLDAPIASGGTAIVYRARDLQRDPTAPGGQWLALKMLRPEQRERAGSGEGLRREFLYAQALPHPHIVRVFDFVCDAGLSFLTLELLEGESLAALLARRDNEPLAPRRALAILKDCAEALGFAHARGIVHGDFKPGNVFVTRTGDVRVLDFGAAAALWESGDAFEPAATPSYASPQVLERQRPEKRDDVFSFACVAYELLTGRHPFGRRSSLEARAVRLEPARAWNLSLRQWHTLDAALSWEREQRPTSPRALIAELAAAEIPAPLVIPEIRGELRTTRPPPLAPIAAAVSIAVLALALFVARYEPDERAGSADRVPAAGLAESAAQSADQRMAGARPGASRLSLGASPSPASAGAARDERRGTAPSPEAGALPPLVTFDAPLVVVSEGAVSAVMTLNRRQRLAGRTLVKWRTQAGSAEPGRDFVATQSGTAEFADGQSARAIYIPLLNDRLAERAETFSVELYAPQGDARINPTARAEARILDDD
jgi:tRNA A-37 threonylcarbamoyl transferase component Bud32